MDSAGSRYRYSWNLISTCTYTGVGTPAPSTGMIRVTINFWGQSGIQILSVLGHIPLKAPQAIFLKNRSVKCLENRYKKNHSYRWLNSYENLGGGGLNPKPPPPPPPKFS
uniref:Uncharacterized protein n=1 Tax=Cacopsylla melanoneura TaxID=428564 RepID=A0A8D8XM20_9HEMI